MPPEETEIRQAARAVIPFLDELLGAQRAEAFAEEISAAPDDEHIVELAHSEPVVSEWIADYLDAATSSFRYTGLRRRPGASGTVGEVPLSARDTCVVSTVRRRGTAEMPCPRCRVGAGRQRRSELMVLISQIAAGLRYLTREPLAARGLIRARGVAGCLIWQLMMWC